MAKSRFGFDNQQAPNKWSPKYPDIAIDKGHDPRQAIQGEPGETTTWGKNWYQAPADSHLWGFALEDYRDVRHKPMASIALDRKSRVLVRFKPPVHQPSKGITEYEYLFEDHDEAGRYFDKMMGHTDPGEVVWEMIRAGVPYAKLAG